MRGKIAPETQVEIRTEKLKTFHEPYTATHRCCQAVHRHNWDPIDIFGIHIVAPPMTNLETVLPERGNRPEGPFLCGRKSHRYCESAKCCLI